MNRLCTKQPLNKGHPYITAKMLFPKGGRYRGFHCIIMGIGKSVPGAHTQRRLGYRLSSFFHLWVPGSMYSTYPNTISNPCTCMLHCVYQYMFVDNDLLSIHAVLVSGSQKMMKTFAENKLNCLERERENPVLSELMVAT